MDKLKEKLKDVPKSPGVYQFRDKNAVVLYVGKAKNLKSRIGQYLNGHDDRDQIPYLLEEATDFDYTVVNNELESLYLENTLIKQYLPKYNILLRDDKNYAFITIDYSTEIPQIGYARKIDNGKRHPERSEGSLKIVRKRDSSTFAKASADKSGALGMTPRTKYFGPYSAAYKIRTTLNLTRRIFPFCAAEKVSSRPCFYYYLHRCPGVCVGKITLDEYKTYLHKIEHFLAGDTKKIKQELQNEMKLASSRREFEKAARLRDQYQALQLLDERQTVILPKAVAWDVVSLAVDQGYACINLFKIREGKLFDKENFIYETTTDLQKGSTTENYRNDVLQSFLERYYLETSSAPKIIYIQNPIENSELIEQIIKSRFEHKAEVSVPQKGKSKGLIKLGLTNAQEYLKNWMNERAGNLDKINTALLGLKEILHLTDVPQRIECYDISNIQGTNAVGSMVVFEKGLPKKSQYRKFRIKTKKTPDDFAMMREMLSRRFAHSVIARPSASEAEAILNHEKITSSADKALPPRNDKGRWPLPDLIVIDGGKGQLSAALEVLQKFQMPNFKFQIIGLAKKIEEIFVPGKSEPIILSHDDPALQLLQRLRDEAHRFGITYHRALRSKQAVRSALDDIPGIGPKTKKILKQKFGTVANIRKISLEDLSAVVGRMLAEKIKSSL